jgi:signal transduction histidine kinase
MTEKAREDYQTLKEFTENASHELQTPTAIIRGKLDLLMESDIRDEQAILIAEMQNALERLSRVHSSLTLLTKLENQEYEVGEPVRISHLVQETLVAFGELIELKSLVLQAHIEKGIYVPIHASLADLLLTNLISNAIRHNSPPPGGGRRIGALQAGGKGFIGVQLTKDGLVIVNTGAEPRVPTQELFERFKKGNSGGDSIGIGLAIVRQICELSHFDIVYEYREEMHRVAVAFRPTVPPSKLLQNFSFALRSI